MISSGHDGECVPEPVSVPQWWCINDPSTGKQRTVPQQRTLTGEQAGERAAAFLRWYILEGHPGHPTMVRDCQGLWMVGWFLQLYLSQHVTLAP